MRANIAAMAQTRRCFRWRARRRHTSPREHPRRW